ncbi:MAG: flagellar biosynthesis protein [Paracoccaceae bacterium]
MPLKLEVFESAERAAGRIDTVVLDTVALEEAKLAAYDKGYSAGWEDAVGAQTEDQARIKADLARNLQLLSFTYQEARQHVLQSLNPLLGSIVERVLPTLARASLAPMILEILRPIAESTAEPPVTIAIHPSARAAVEGLVLDTAGLPVEIREEDTLGEGTAFVRFDGAETQIDLDDAVRRIARAVHDFFEMQRKDSDNGQPQ